MLDAKIQEQASLYVLDLLPEQEKLEVDLLIARDLEVRELVRDLQLNVEAMALSAPPVTAPGDIWRRIEARINSKHTASKPNLWRQMWLPLAACFVLGAILSWITLRSVKPIHNETQALIAAPADSPPKRAILPVSNTTITVADPAKLSNMLALQKQDLKKLDQALSQERTRHRALENQFENLSSNANRLTEQLAYYQTTPPGSKRLLVMSLANPTNTAPSFNFAQIANKILAEEAQKHLASEAANKVKNSIVPTNTLIAAATPTGTTLQANSLANGSSPTDVLTSSGTNTASMAESGKNASLPGEFQAAAVSETGVNPAGILIFDQSDQKGSLVLYGMIQPPTGLHFQAWTVDFTSGQIFHLGTLPSLVDGSGQVQINLQNSNLTPSRFVITLESGLNFTAPAGPVILDSGGSAP